MSSPGPGSSGREELRRFRRRRRRIDRSSSFLLVAAVLFVATFFGVASDADAGWGKCLLWATAVAAVGGSVTLIWPDPS